jgi:isopentenyldiphosphate isomerase
MDEHVVKVSDYRYTFVRDGVMENEFCPIFVVFTNERPYANPVEVNDTIYMTRLNWLDELQSDLP